MPPACLIYRCRLCGAEVESVGVPDATMAMAYLTSEHWTPHAWGARVGLHGTHDCLDGVIGLTDLIGARTRQRYRPPAPTGMPD